MKQMQPQDKAIHDMLTAQSKELRQFLDFLEKKDNLQNISLKRTQDQVNQNTVNIFGLQESLKRIEQQMNSQTIKQLEQKINALEEKMDLAMIPPKKFIDESAQEQIEELSKMLQDIQNNLQNLQDQQPKIQLPFQQIFPSWQKEFPQPLLQQVQAQITDLKNQYQKDYQGIKFDLSQLKNLIKNSEFKIPQMNTQNFQIAEFYQAKEQIYQTNISDQNYSETQFEFIVEEYEYPFSIGIIQDGDLENQDSKVKSLQIQFPSGQLIRGAEDPINFLPRQFLRNDRVQIKVLKEKELFMVTLNGIDIPPIKIREDLSNQHAFVVKSEYPLQDIIS